MFPSSAFCRKRFRKELHELEKGVIFLLLSFLIPPMLKIWPSNFYLVELFKSHYYWLNIVEKLATSWEFEKFPELLRFPNCFKMVLICLYCGTRCVTTYWAYIRNMKDQRSSIDFWWSPAWNIVPRKEGYKRRFPLVIHLLIVT